MNLSFTFLLFYLVNKVKFDSDVFLFFFFFVRFLFYSFTFFIFYFFSHLALSRFRVNMACPLKLDSCLLCSDGKI